MLMQREGSRKALRLLGAFVLFQGAVVCSELLRPPGEMAGMASAERWTSTLQELADPSSYLNPFAAFFLYLALIKWAVVDRVSEPSVAATLIYHALFGLYYGALFREGLNGALHSSFDRALGINPGPLLSAVFPLALAFILPALLTLLLRVSALTLRRRPSIKESV